MTEQDNQPIRKFRGELGLSLAIWENRTTGEDGKTRARKSATLQKSYRKQGDSEWSQSEISLFPADIPVARALLDRASSELPCTITEEEISDTSS